MTFDNSIITFCIYSMHYLHNILSFMPLYPMVWDGFRMVLIGSYSNLRLWLDSSGTVHPHFLRSDVNNISFLFKSVLRLYKMFTVICCLLCSSRLSLNFHYYYLWTCSTTDRQRKTRPRLNSIRSPYWVE